MDGNAIAKLAAASGPNVADSLIVALGVLIGRSAPSVMEGYQNLWMIIATVAVVYGLIRIGRRRIKGGSGVPLMLA